mgnify:CR=1 FL=1
MGVEVTSPTHFLAMDERNHWFVFDRKDALGEFETWQAADEHRKKLGAETAADEGPAWAPKSGGY